VADVIETDFSTNPPTVTERDFTPEELAQLEADRVAAEQAAQAAADKAAADAAARDAAIAHAKSLGFTDAMIAVMYPNLTMEA
jgi:hypothetical protein